MHAPVPVWIALAMVAAIGLMILLGIVVIVSLFASEKGRTILKVLLIVPALVVVLAFLAVVTQVRMRHERAEAQMAVQQARKAEAYQRAREALQAALEKGDDALPAAVGSPEVAVDSAETPTKEKPAGAEDRPDWVEAEPGKVGGVYRTTITVGPYSTRLECDRELPGQLHAAVEEYAAEYVGPEARGQVRLPLDYIESEIVQAEWAEQKPFRISPEGKIPEEYHPMTLLHVLLEFDPANNNRIKQAWDAVVVRQRLFGVGALSAMVLGLLSAAYGYLRIDLATGGAYRGRLRLTAAAVVLALVVAGLVLSAV